MTALTVYVSFGRTLGDRRCNNIFYRLINLLLRLIVRIIDRQRLSSGELKVGQLISIRSKARAVSEG